MTEREKLLRAIRMLRDGGNRLNCGQQQLLVVLDRKCNIHQDWCHCCAVCLELMDHAGQHACGQQSTRVQIRERTPSTFVPYAFSWESIKP